MIMSYTKKLKDCWMYRFVKCYVQQHCVLAKFPGIWTGIISLTNGLKIDMKINPKLMVDFVM